MTDGLLVGLSGGYVDDLLRKGTAEFRTISKRTNQPFQMSKEEEILCNFSGFSPSRNKKVWSDNFASWVFIGGDRILLRL